ncbi:MAG TPA: prolipoprotein diacylglyceryl transferase [Myxococcales bacterium]|jgi:phosphatidylglycerol---prolipoprotein diacylglyceryl transferase|nr:prolipoprotein diacylglyceryl transferase [Myxococcales bacterium]
MLPILITLTLSPRWAPFVLAALSLALAAWQARAARVAGDSARDAARTFVLWAVGTALAFFLLVRVVGEPGNQNLLDLSGPLTVPLHTYGLLIATAFIVAMWLAGRTARRAGLDEGRVMDLCFWILISSMIGSRLLFIAVNWEDYAREPWSVFAFWKGGLVFYGGFLGAAACSVWYMRRHHMQFFAYADALIPSVAIGHAIGRLGCFAAGCCWGGACDVNLPWAARFPPESLAYQSQVASHVIQSGALHTIAIHPTQLYESLGELAIFLVLTTFRPHKRFGGELLALYLVLYAPLRATVEMLRGDEERGRVFNFAGAMARGAWWNLSTSELISALIFCAGVALLVLLGRRPAEEHGAAA